MPSNAKTTIPMDVRWRWLVGWLVVVLTFSSSFFSFLFSPTLIHPNPSPPKRYLCLPPRLDGCDLCVSRVAKYGFFVDGRDGRGQFRKQRQPHCCDEAGWFSFF
jgi:hypothetical protein